MKEKKSKSGKILNNKLNKPNVTKKTRERVFKIIDSAISAVSLLMSLRILTAEDPNELPSIYLTIYLLLAVSKVFQCMIVRKTDKLKFIVHIVSAVVFVASSIPAMILGLTVQTGACVMSAYFLVLLSDRVVSIIRNRTLRNILLNAIAGALLIMMIISTFMPGDYFGALLYLHAFMLTAAALGHIISISFSQMRFNVLQKIIRKTFAVEILFGLALLIVSFSFVFVPMEESINTYADAVWYCFAIVTTIGFGDFTAVTLIGRLLSIILGIYGIVVVALITSIIVNFYNEVKDEKEEKEKKEVVKEVVKEIEEKNDEE